MYERVHESTESCLHYICFVFGFLGGFFACYKTFKSSETWSQVSEMNELFPHETLLMKPGHFPEFSKNISEILDLTLKILHLFQ